MQLFIRLQDGNPFEHPIFEDNFREAFPEVDTENLPPEFAKFIRVEPPSVGVYEVYEGVTYERSGDVFTDVHHVRSMTQQEIESKQNEMKSMWAEHGFPSWIFDESKCLFVSPVEKPDNNKLYRWDESTTSWVEFTGV